MLILAAVSIAMLTGNNGIINQAQGAKENNEVGKIEEQVKLAVMAARTEGLGSIDIDILNSELNKIDYNGTTIETLPAEVTIDGVTVKINENGTTGIVNEDDEENDEEIDEEEKDDTVVIEPLGITPSINEEEMTPVKYDETTGTWIESDSTAEGEWFDYSKKEWANVETENGYYVYIPRYAYKITSGYHQESDVAGTIAIVFLNEDNTLKTTKDSEGNTVNQNDLITADQVNSSVANEGLNATTKYIIHPAFTEFDTSEKKVDGLWVAKYEMSMEETTDGGKTWNTVITSDESIGDVSIATSTTKRMTSKPGVKSWRHIKVTNIFSNCYNMNRDLDSHMMKNTEWGALAYLTVSQYGKGATSEVEPNWSDYTGYGADSKLSTGAASSTGNMYGVFDMSAGSKEYVAAYLNDVCMQRGGENYAYNESLIKANAKYKNVYQLGTTNIDTDCMIANNLKVGDALWEVRNHEVSSNANSWYGDNVGFPGGDDVDETWHSPVFSRSFFNLSFFGSLVGIFNANGEFGDTVDGNSFRVVCVVM